ncbi:hypothetical protein PMAYCL1PPCAC_04383, partial [Pristionchus mayeri]
GTGQKFEFLLTLPIGRSRRGEPTSIARNSIRIRAVEGADAEKILRHTLLALNLCLLSLLLGLFVHSERLSNSGMQEYDSVRSYVMCVAKNTLSSKDTHWLHEEAHAEEKWDNGMAEAVPLERR